MKQEKGRPFNNISKGVNSTRTKLKQTAISTPIKNAPLTAKVNSTWNNVLHKNKDSTVVGKISGPNKFEINLAKNEPVKTLRYFVTELQNKIDILLPGNRAVNNIVENILKTFSKMEQPFKIQDLLNNSKPPKSQAHPQLSIKNTKDTDTKDLRQLNEQLNDKVKENIEENSKLRKDMDDMKSELLILKNELSVSEQRVEKLESTLNETVNTERETIANYEQQCKRLQNQIKTLQENASQIGHRSAANQTQSFDRILAPDTFKYQMQMAFKELEKEKLLTILKYDKNQYTSSYSEFYKIYELIQQYFSSDRSQEMQILFNAQLNKNKRK